MDFSVVSPQNLSQLRNAIRTLQRKPYRIGAGYTDLLMELRKSDTSDLTVINLAQINDNGLSHIKSLVNHVHIGAMVTATSICMNDDIARRFPTLQQAAANLASTQIRNVATIGGNLCTASPSGDMACAIVALKAHCVLMNVDGKKRVVPVVDFFTGPRTTCLKKNEFLYKIILPRNHKQTQHIHSGFIKVGTRNAMECSVVSLAYHIQVEESGYVIDAGIGIGASAPTIRFAEKAALYLIGKNMQNFTDENRNEFAKKVLTYASPISDVRATSWYRKEVLYNISKSVLV